MQRDDQLLINYYHKVCRETAKRHMLVDFHGGQKQITMTRTWPNMNQWRRCSRHGVE